MKIKGNHVAIYNFSTFAVYENGIIYNTRSRKLQIAGLEIKFKKKIKELYIYNIIYIKDQKAAESGGFEGYSKLVVDSYIIYYK